MKISSSKNTTQKQLKRKNLRARSAILIVANAFTILSLSSLLSPANAEDRIEPAPSEQALLRAMNASTSYASANLIAEIYNPQETLESLRNLPRAKIPGSPDEARPVTVFSLPQLQRLYAKLLNQKQIIFEDSKANNHEGGCFARAEEIVRVMEQNGMMADKLFLLPSQSPNGSIHARDSKTGEVFDWGYHVMPVVLVAENGQLVKYVIDPVLSRTPIRFDRLISKLLWSDGFNGEFDMSIADRDAYDINSIRIGVLQKWTPQGRFHDSMKVLEDQRQAHENHSK